MGCSRTSDGTLLLFAFRSRSEAPPTNALFGLSILSLLIRQRLIRVDEMERKVAIVVAL
jgi:hypothetical protein